MMKAGATEGRARFLVVLLHHGKYHEHGYDTECPERLEKKENSVISLVLHKQYRRTIKKEKCHHRRRKDKE